MKMEAVSCFASSDVDNKELEELFGVFGSAFSLEDISSAYLCSNCDKNLANEVLSGVHGSTSRTANAEKLEADNVASFKLTTGGNATRAVSSELSPALLKNTREFKSKRCSASMRTVSGVLGKEYANPRPSTHHSVEAKKPLILDSKNFPVSEVWCEKKPLSMFVQNGTMQADIEAFLFKMLGDGFQLDMTLIQEVLGRCGYDMHKSFDEFLDLSASTLEKSDDVASMAAEKFTQKHLDQESLSHQERMQQLHFTHSNRAERDEGNPTDSLNGVHYRFDLEKDILQSLFDLPDRSEEAPSKTHIMREARRLSAFSKPVVTPLKETTKEYKPSAAKPLVDTTEEAEHDENSYEVLRKAVKEYGTTMKEYYKAAVDAFAEGDHARADKLMDQQLRYCHSRDNFLMKRPEKQDEKSFQKLMEITRDDEVVSLDLLGFEPKEALHSLRLHLTSFSGISSIKYLRVVIGGDEDDSMKGRRKRLIVKQLEKDSIKWSEEGNGGSILIQVDVIDPKRLSFAEKYKFGESKPKPGMLGYQVSQHLI